MPAVRFREASSDVDRALDAVNQSLIRLGPGHQPEQQATAAYGARLLCEAGKHVGRLGRVRMNCSAGPSDRLPTRAYCANWRGPVLMGCIGLGAVSERAGSGRRIRHGAGTIPELPRAFVSRARCQDLRSRGPGCRRAPAPRAGTSRLLVVSAAGSGRDGVQSDGYAGRAIGLADGVASRAAAAVD